MIEAQRLADALPVMIAFIDRNLVHKFANLCYTEWFGEVEGKTLEEVLPEEVYTLRKNAFVRALAGERVHYEVELSSVLDETIVHTFDVECVPHPDGFFLCRIDLTAVSARATRPSSDIDPLVQLIGPSVVSDTQFRVFAENLPILAWMAKADGHIFWYNKGWYEYTGTNLVSMEGWGWKACHHPDFIDDVVERWSHSIRIGDTFQMTFPLLGGDGIYRFFDTRIIAAKDKNGNVIRWYGVNIDVTKQIEAETRFKAIVDSTVDPLIVIDADGIIQTVNPAVERQIGYSSGETIGYDIKMIIPDNLASKHSGFLENYKKTGIKKVVGQVTPVNVQRKNGTTYPAELAVSEWEMRGRPYFTGVIKDVTSQRSYEEYLKTVNTELVAEIDERSRELEMHFAISKDLIGVMNIETDHFTMLSPAWERITGFTVEYGKSKPFTEFVHPADLNISGVAHSNLVDGNTVSGFRNRYIHADGSYRWIEWNVVPDSQNPLVYFVARDVTQERIDEETLRHSQKMEAVRQLTGGIAHDFNNLLMGITGSLDLMKRKLPQDQFQLVEKYITGAMGSAKRAAALTHRLLAFSRKQPLAPKIVNVNTLVTSIKELIDRTIGPSVNVQLSLDENVWNTRCDPNQLENAILNASLNARDAMPNGGNLLLHTTNISREKSRRLSLNEGEFVCISLKDDGVGMTEDVQVRAFDPFFTTKPIGQGSGMGLSMLYGFINQTGGQVKIESEVGKGTTILLYLPKSLGQCTEETSAAEPVVTKVLPRDILIVEDDKTIMSLVKEALISVGHKCLCAVDGLSALHIIEDKDINVDLLISDVGLPNMNGKQLAIASRVHRADLKVIFITGYAEGMPLRDDLLIDNSEMLLKPFNIETLISLVQNMTS